MDIQRESTKGVRLVKVIAEEGYRVFDTNIAKLLAPKANIAPSYLNDCLHNLVKIEWILPIKKGLYCLAPEFLAGGPLREYEIAMALAPSSAISCWSAMHYHSLTQQIPNRIFVLMSSEDSLPRVGDQHSLSSIRGVEYQFIRVNSHHYFGIKQVWIDETRIRITDKERTLIDCLARPQYCGGFDEVIEAFTYANQTEFNIPKLVDYSNKMGPSIIKRLGWHLENIGIVNNMLLGMVTDGYIKLNPVGTARGKYNKRWMVQENI